MTPLQRTRKNLAQASTRQISNVLRQYLRFIGVARRYPYCIRRFVRVGILLGRKKERCRRNAGINTIPVDIWCFGRGDLRAASENLLGRSSDKGGRTPNGGIRCERG